MTRCKTCGMSPLAICMPDCPEWIDRWNAHLDLLCEAQAAERAAIAAFNTHRAAGRAAVAEIVKTFEWLGLIGSVVPVTEAEPHRYPTVDGALQITAPPCAHEQRDTGAHPYCLDCGAGLCQCAHCIVEGRSEPERDGSGKPAITGGSGQ